MRLSISAAILAVLTLWPTSGEAKDLESVIHCGGRLFANGVLRYTETNDASSLEGPNFLMNVAAYASFKESQGHVPGEEAYDRFYDAVGEEAKVFSRQYDRRRDLWDPEAYLEIVACYDELSTYSLTDGVKILDENELLTARLHTALQIGNLRNSE